MKTTTVPRFTEAQKGRTLIHPNLKQPTTEDEVNHLIQCSEPENDESPSEPSQQECLTDAPALLSEENERVTSEIDCHSPSHSFVVCADTQLGMKSLNNEWMTELEYCEKAVDKINALHPRPKFACVCGDLVDMEHTFYANKPNALKQYERDECDRIQDEQNRDFKKVFAKVHPDIALVCLCGNHDIGNRPTPESITKFTNAFGDEYLAFWTNGTYNIVLNNVIFVDPSGAEEIFKEQLEWLEGRLQYAKDHRAAQIYIFAHHPWFLYDENETADSMIGGSPFPVEWDDGTGRFDGVSFPDHYFIVPKKYRMIALDLFKEFQVDACFTGHFHQNHVSKTSFGMDMIITAPLSMVFESTGKEVKQEENGRGIRIVNVEVNPEKNRRRQCGDGSFTHTFERI